MQALLGRAGFAAGRLELRVKVAWGGVVCALCALGEEKMRVTKSNARDKGCRLPYRNAVRSCLGLDGRLPVPLTSGQGFSAVTHPKS